MTTQDLIKLTTATLTGQKVIADYTDAHGNRTSRQFQPEQCDRHGFLARCDLRGDWRRFKAERIRNVRVCEPV